MKKLKEVFFEALFNSVACFFFLMAFNSTSKIEVNIFLLILGSVLWGSAVSIWFLFGNPDREKGYVRIIRLFLFYSSTIFLFNNVAVRGSVSEHIIMAIFYGFIATAIVIIMKKWAKKKQK